MKIDPCPGCGEHFDNIFQATDHLLEEDEQEQFDPVLILPNGYKLLVGSLLRTIFAKSSNPEQVRDIIENTYGTLYAAETAPGLMKKFIEEAIVSEHMYNMDEQLIELLQEEADDE